MVIIMWNGKKKAVTFSYDDGVEQDRRLIALFNKYGMKATFNQNSGIQTRADTFIFLSNIENITFDQAWKAAGFSSNMDDYFDVEVAKFVGMK